MYISSSCLKMAEVDNWEHGCIDSPLNYQCFIDYTIKGESLEELKQEIADFTGAPMDSIMVNPCEDDPSRIDAQLTENKEGFPANSYEMEKFKSGEIDLFAVTYSFLFDEVTRKPANFN